MHFGAIFLFFSPGEVYIAQKKRNPTAVMQCVVSPSSGDIFSSSSISVLYEHNAAPHMLCCPHYYYYWLQRYEEFLKYANFTSKI